MTRTGADAVHYARGRVGPNAMPASGYCLQFVRECFAVGSYYGSAIDAWNGAQRKHPGDRNPPMAVPLYFKTPSKYDHVVFGGDPGGGEIITTFNADVRRYTGPDAIAQIERDFDGTYLGWAEDINRVTVWSPPAPPEDDVTPEEVYAQSAAATKDVLRSDEFQGYIRDLPWRASIGDANGTDYSANWLVVARQAPETNEKLDTLVTASVTTARARNTYLLVFAIVILLATVGGVAIGLLSETRDGVVAGVAALVGSLITVILREIRSQ